MNLANKKAKIAERFKNGSCKMSSLLSSSIEYAGTLENKRNWTLDSAYIQDDSLTKIHAVSCLYMYTNPPPAGYGTPGPKVAESIERAYKFNPKPEGTKKINIMGYEIEDSKWNSSLGLFPINSVNSAWSAFHVTDMAVKFLYRNHNHIVRVAQEVIEYMSVTNSDILTKGRQTWCPLHLKSVPSAVAHVRYTKFIHDNSGVSVHTCLDLLKEICTLMTLPRLKTTKIKTLLSVKKIYSPSKRTVLYKKIVKRQVLVHYTNSAEESFKVIMDHLRTFCSYIKEGERGKKDRRAIASPTIPLRLFLLIVEEFHLKLGKLIPGSTISIGGDEKKQKIEVELSSISIPGATRVYSAQGTEDATKWNETMMPAALALMHHTFFNDRVRMKLGLVKMHEDEKLFGTICEHLFAVLAVKRVYLGPGLRGENDEYSSLIEWKASNMNRFNARTREWFQRVVPYLEEDMYLRASAGFLMGMLNAASTTMGLLANSYALMSGQACMTLRSSDDSMSVYLGATPDKLRNCIEVNRLSLKYLAINLSDSKTFFFREGFGEYTSWYQEGTFVTQYGQETSSIRPGAQNPQDDFNNIAKLTQTAMLNFSINVIGATMRLMLGVANVRRLYHIEVNPAKREDVSDKVLFLADGGICPWGIWNLGIDEATLRYKGIDNETEKAYFYKVMNPDNPFQGAKGEEIMFSRDSSRLVLIEPDTPRNIFCYIKRSNKSAKSAESKQRAEREKACSAIYRTVTMADPSLLVKIPASKLSIRDHLVASLRLLQSQSGLDPEEKDEVQATIDKVNQVDVLKDPFDFIID